MNVLELLSSYKDKPKQLNCLPFVSLTSGLNLTRDNCLQIGFAWMSFWSTLTHVVKLSGQIIFIDSWYLLLLVQINCTWNNQYHQFNLTLCIVNSCRTRYSSSWTVSSLSPWSKFRWVSSDCDLIISQFLLPLLCRRSETARLNGSSSPCRDHKAFLWTVLVGPVFPTGVPIYNKDGSPVILDRASLVGSL